MLADIRHEARARRRGRFPAGSNAFNMRVTQRFRRDPLEVLLEMRERHGPVFGLRLLYGDERVPDRPRGEPLHARRRS